VVVAVRFEPTRYGQSILLRVSASLKEDRKSPPECSRIDEAHPLSVEIVQHPADLAFQTHLAEPLVIS
jgi:hypothetical protein